MQPNPKYLKIFRTEATELVSRIAGQLLDLEEGKADVGALRQDLHTLKGSARLVGLKDIGQLVHGLETFSRDGGPLLSGAGGAVDLALEVLDLVEGLAGLGKPEPSPEEVEAAEGRMQTFQVDAPRTPAESPASRPAEPPPEPRSADLEFEASSESVRVAVRALDQLLNLSGELLLQHRRMEARFDHGRRILGLIDSLRAGGRPSTDEVEVVAEAVDTLTRDLESDMVDAGFLFSEVRSRTTEIRLQTLDTLLEPLTRQVRAESRKLGKPVQLQVRGGRLEIDRTILEQLKPVLVHCLTNAVVHGIEEPDERRAAGKPEEGRVRVEASSDGNRIQILVEDDGRGLDPRILRSAAVEKGLFDEAAAQEMSDDDALGLIFTPGFTTTRKVTDMAGRGVGMDAVRANVERLRGQLRVESDQGRYTRITFVLPAAIGVIQGLVLSVGGESLVLPTIDVAGTRPLEPGAYDPEAGTAVVPDAPPAPALPLGAVLGWEAPDARPLGGTWEIRLYDLEGALSLLVDGVTREEEIVLKHPGRILAELPLVAGATLFGDGTPALVLRGNAVARIAREVWSARHGALPGVAGAPADVDALPSGPPPGAESGADRTAAGPAPSSEEGPAILVADDSETARAMLEEALGGVGHPLVVARDGREALDVLERRPVLLVVTDFDMPELDGLQLLRALREDPRWEDLPVVMVTDRADEVRESALAQGAQEVLRKSPETYAQLEAAVRERLGAAGSGDLVDADGRE